MTLPETPIYVHADRTRLAQVFANLLNNSSKFSDRGQPISIAITHDGGQAVVRVRDTGVGIPREALPKIFDMFGQADLPRRALARRPRHRPLAGQADRRNARRHRRGAQ